MVAGIVKGTVVADRTRGSRERGRGGSDGGRRPPLKSYSRSSQQYDLPRAVHPTGRNRTLREQATPGGGAGFRLESRVSEADTPAGEPEDPLIEASAEPRRRPRTPLTDEEVDAMRTARANGISVIALANQHGIHRGTAWRRLAECEGLGTLAYPACAWA